MADGFSAELSELLHGHGPEVVGLGDVLAQIPASGSRSGAGDGGLGHGVSGFPWSLWEGGGVGQRVVTGFRRLVHGHARGRAGFALYQNVSCFASLMHSHAYSMSRVLRVSCLMLTLTSGLRPIPPGLTTMTTTSDGE